MASLKLKVTLTKEDDGNFHVRFALPEIAIEVEAASTQLKTAVISAATTLQGKLAEGGFEATVNDIYAALETALENGLAAAPSATSPLN